MKSFRTRTAVCIFFLLATVSSVFADEFHYNNILIGDRAAGMGGAYTAISDDPSGMYYNPAGLAYISGRSISASVNAYTASRRTYKGVMGGKDWTRTSSSLLPNFFGIVQPVGKLKLGFSYAVPDSNQEDQDQSFDYSGQIQVINFNNRNDTTLFGPSAAVMLTDDLSIGATLYVHKRNTEAILSQSSKDTANAANIWANDYLETDEWGLRPIVGLLWSPADKVSVGLTAQKTVVLTSDILKQHTDWNAGETEITRSNPTMETTDDKRKYPYQVTAGIAIFPSQSLLISADLTYNSAYRYDFLEKNISRESVINGSIGTEYYFSPIWALRGGFFTDFANTPELDSAKTGQVEHIDLYGGSLSLSHFTKNTSLSVGGNYKIGKGESQITGAGPIQDVELQSWSLFVSSSYSY